MSKLYFKHGTMGSSKTANLLMTKFNYEEKNKQVWLIKPNVDNRDGDNIIKSRIGLSAKVDYIIKENDNIFRLFSPVFDVVLVDEAQFLTEEQIDQLHMIVSKSNVPVICYGLLTDFTTHLFEGSKRLVEIAESIQEIKTICKCGKKATVNARIDSDGNVVKSGKQIHIGGNESYTSMCYECWNK